ncbi:hypothetical protein PV327_004152 [Microctonus hyperodae]|uniref:Uncharacterized protein n=1 Tax=Microctonus hyperodae TaxID=165561 RepID=A0AA39KM83_MICHY|nr:hypothetical protein PV327_004152 [Microctonus hyperodae]
MTQRGRIPEVVSVAEFPMRTNNICEGFSKQMPTKLGGPRPPMYRFIKKITKIIKNCGGRYGELEAGKEHHKSRHDELEEIEVNEVLADPDYLPEESIASDDSFIRRPISQSNDQGDESISQQSEEYSSPDDTDEAGSSDDDDDDRDDDDDSITITNEENLILSSPSQTGTPEKNDTVGVFPRKTWKRCRPLPQTSSDDEDESSDIEICVPRERQKEAAKNEEITNIIMVNLIDDEEINLCEDADSDDTLFELD